MPKYNWDHIRLRYESGETAYGISQDLNGKPSKQAIMKQAEKGAWTKPDKEVLQVTEHLPSVRRAFLHTNSKRTPETIEIICDMLRQGTTLAIAAQTAGIHPETLSTWRKTDPGLRNLFDRSRASSLATSEQVIYNAQFKDWKAADRRLQVAPETRDQYGKQSQDSKLEVVININRAQGNDTAATIDGESVRIDTGPEITADTA